MANENKEEKTEEKVEVVTSQNSRIVCDKHGDVTEALFVIPYKVKEIGEDGKESMTTYKHFFCMQCLASYFNKLTEDGVLGKLSMISAVNQEIKDEK